MNTQEQYELPICFEMYHDGVDLASDNKMCVNQGVIADK